MALKTYTWVTGDYAYKSWSNGYKIHLTLTEESISTDDNTSVVSYKFWVSNGSNNRFIDDNWNWNISIGGQTIAIKNFDFYVYPYNVTQTIASGKITVKHNSDGSLNMPYNVSVPNVKASNQYGMPAMSLSGTWTLTEIPRQASITSVASFTDESNPIIYYSNPAGNEVESLQACIANDTGGVQYVKYRDIPKTGTSYQFVLTDEERNVLYAATPNSNTLKVRFYVKTVIGETSYYSNVAKTMTIVNANPVVSASVADTNNATIALTGDNQKFIKYYSNVKVTATVTAQKGATITETTGTGTYNETQKNSWSVEAIDSRGNATKKTVSGTLISYVKLTCNIESTIPDANGNIDVRCTGGYFNGSFGKVANTLEVKCRYKKPDGTYSDWYTMTSTKNGNYYGAYKSLTIPDFDYQAVYTFECQATDKLATVSSASSPVKSRPAFHWGENDFVFEVPVTFNGGVNAGGVWTPTLSSAAVSSYSTQRGWYSKLGNVVTIGFYVKATCKSGYDTTLVTIGGLPFSPLYGSAGGGMCSGAYVSAGYTFQCFVAETDGTISTRVQACNNTTAANLSTSKSGCWYPSGGGEITISGTITYVTE